MVKTKIEIKSVLGSLLFSFEAENNSVKKTLLEAIKSKAYLQGAYLQGAYLQGADLQGAYLQGAYLRRAYLQGAYLRRAYLQGADLRRADLQGADLQGADLQGADLQGADLRETKDLPQSFVNLCSRDILFIFQNLKAELPFLKEKLLKGEIDGTQYEGNCACLVGTLANADGGLDKVCKTIPFYDKGLHNPGEQWFYNIRKGDTPKNNLFAKHVLKLIDGVLEGKK